MSAVGVVAGVVVGRVWRVAKSAILHFEEDLGVDWFDSFVLFLFSFLLIFDFSFEISESFA